MLNAPVPIELKVADNNWSGTKLFERLESQLIGDYLRDPRSNCGIFMLLFRGEKTYWEADHFPGEKLSFDQLILKLQKYADVLVSKHDKVEEVKVLGVDLTKRSE
jgi:hypothetical protein